MNLDERAWKAEQAEELEALAAIFDEDFRLISSEPLQFEVRVRSEFDPLTRFKSIDVLLHVELPKCYPTLPSALPRIFVCPKSPLLEKFISQQIEQRAGQPLIFEVVQAVQGKLQEEQDFVQQSFACLDRCGRNPVFLPVELILHIFQYLSPKDLGSAMLVNHFWRSVASSHSLWQGACSRYLSASADHAEILFFIRHEPGEGICRDRTLTPARWAHAMRRRNLAQQHWRSGTFSRDRGIALSSSDVKCISCCKETNTVVFGDGAGAIWSCSLDTEIPVAYNPSPHPYVYGVGTLGSDLFVSSSASTLAVWKLQSDQIESADNRSQLRFLRVEDNIRGRHLATSGTRIAYDLSHNNGFCVRDVETMKVIYSSTFIRDVYTLNMHDNLIAASFKCSGSYVMDLRVATFCMKVSSSDFSSLDLDIHHHRLLSGEVFKGKAHLWDIRFPRRLSTMDKSSGNVWETVLTPHTAILRRSNLIEVWSLDDLGTEQVMAETSPTFSYGITCASYSHLIDYQRHPDPVQTAGYYALAYHSLQVYSFL